MSLVMLIPFAGMATGLVITLSVVRLIHRFIDRRDAGGTDEELRNEVQALRDQVETLEERLDFAERLLARGTGRAPIAPES